jgi:hypothetical protein
VLDNNTAQTTTFGVVLPGARFSVPLAVTFNDLGDLGDVASNVPDNSSTLGMMALSSAAMFGFVRFRKSRA